MEAPKIELLEALPGHSWDPLVDAFDTGLDALRMFAEREGHLRITLRTDQTRGVAGRSSQGAPRRIV